MLGEHGPRALRSILNILNFGNKTVDMLVQNQIQVYGDSTQYATFGSFGQLTSYARATGGDVFPGTSTKREKRGQRAILCTLEIALCPRFSQG